MATGRKRRKTSFVPRIVFATAAVGVGVVPQVTGCGNRVTEGVALACFGEGGPFCEEQTFSVAAMCFGDGSSGSPPCFVGVADVAFDVPDEGNGTVGSPLCEVTLGAPCTPD